MNTHEFINYDLKNPTYLLRKELTGVLDERDDIANNEFIEELALCKLVMWCR
jgi:hypothetical protein